MFISKSNVLTNRTPIVITGISSDIPSSVNNPDFSVSYTASGSRLVLKYPNVGQINYVAVCASNFAGASTSRITVRNGDNTPTYNSVRGRYTADRNHVCMFNFESEVVNDLRIIIDSGSASKFPTVLYVAAGNAMQLPNGGEQGGYGRQWLTRNIESRVQGNGLSAPIASLQKRKALSGTLRAPSMLNDFVREDWQRFLDFAASNPFFICEQESVVSFGSEAQYRRDGALPEASYICFNPKFNAPTAHSNTRALQDLQLGFDCYNGL